MEGVKVKYSMIATDSIKDILEDYDIDTVTSCTFLVKGLNDTYLVTTTSATYIFRLYRHDWRHESAILFELDALNHLDRNHFFVSTPINRRDGQSITTIAAPEGKRYGVLFTYIEGNRPEINENNVMLIGRALARLHQATNDFSSPHDRTFELDLHHLLYEPMERIKPVLHHLMGNKHDALLKEVITKIEGSLLDKQLETGFCHGDFHNFNMHIDNGVIGAFDFDCSSTGYRAYDLAVFWWNLTNNYSNVATSCWKAFLEGYKSCRPLNEEDEQSLRAFVSLRRIWFMNILLQNDDVFGTQWIQPQNIQSFIDQLTEDMANI
ncbi:phosphotransferase [Bacillus tianshenii]|uniref:phosphotransferase enzyme family protein n=1 Tax=Sutcliffiella tianshenii TaxID=1463404 RepID=UPI001CD3CE1C|nr:phosphotransferase [Bacillus tianshenii]MCA1318417.1 phosphotransferase [Bacillus tianshenii]